MLLGLLKFIFWFFLISYIFKMAFRFLAPILMNQFVKKMKNKYTHEFDYRNERKSEDKEGDITIKNSSNSKKKKKTKIGEYIDFEELD